MNTKFKTIAAIACGVVACGLSQSAHANLVENGSFGTTTGGSTGQLGYNGFGATDWTPSGGANANYDFVFNGSTADSAGANGIDGNVSLWGPHTPVSFNPLVTYPVANGLTAPPTGGNFLGIDPDYSPTAGPVANSVSQSISGLIKGDTYTLSFYWAAAQQAGFTGATTESWAYSLGNVSGTTTTDNNPSQGFTPWLLDSVTITATSSTELLTFLAQGTGGSTLPPFDLLSDVSLTQNNVPDSSSTAGLLGLGVVAMGVAAGCRRFVRA